MKAKDIQTGQVYIIRHHDGKLHKVRVDSITENYSGRTRYNCTKLSTNREILVRSAAKFRYPAKPSESTPVTEETETFDLPAPIIKAFEPMNKLEREELLFYWRISTTALSGQASGRYERMQYAAREWDKKHPGQHSRAYKQLDCELSH